MSDVIVVMRDGLIQQKGTRRRCTSGRSTASWPTSSEHRTSWTRRSSRCWTRPARGGPDRCGLTLRGGLTEPERRPGVGDDHRRDPPGAPRWSPPMRRRASQGDDPDPRARPAGHVPRRPNRVPVDTEEAGEVVRHQNAAGAGGAQGSVRVTQWSSGGRRRLTSSSRVEVVGPGSTGRRRPRWQTRISSSTSGSSPSLAQTAQPARIHVGERDVGDGGVHRRLYVDGWGDDPAAQQRLGSAFSLGGSVRRALIRRRRELERACSCTTGPTTSTRTTSKAFQSKLGVTKFTYDTYANNEELMAKFQGGATGQWDICCPTMSVAMRAGVHPEDRLQHRSRTPNTSTRIQGSLGGTETTSTPSRRTGGPPGSPSGPRSSTRRSSPGRRSWRSPRSIPKRIVLVDSAGDVFMMPLKALGYSLNSGDQKELEEARQDSARTRSARAGPGLGSVQAPWSSEEAVLGLTWTGGHRGAPRVAETVTPSTTSPRMGRCSGWISWTVLAEAPHPVAAHAFINFIHEPEIQAQETETNYYATPNDEAKEFIDPAILADPTIFVADDIFGSSNPRGTTRGSPSDLRSGKSSSRRSARG